MKLTPARRVKITKWVEALESGKYRQGKNCLCSKDEDIKRWKHCCLGVLCETLEVPSEIKDGMKLYGTHNAVLPPSVAKQFDLIDKSDTGSDWHIPLDTFTKKVKPKYPKLYDKFTNKHEKSYVALSELNDTYDFSFKEIAKVLRAVYLDK